MTPKPLIDYQLVHTFPASRGVLPLEPFAFAGAEYCGEQPSAWESSELSWDSGDPEYGSGRQAAPDRGFGRWHGPGAVHQRPSLLEIEGATVEQLGHDDLARVTTGQAAGGLGLLWSMENPGFIAVAGGLQRIVVQDAATGAILSSTLLPLLMRAAAVPALTGHAVIWARLETAERSWGMPPDYLSVRDLGEVPNRFKYSEGGESYIWDWEADVGRRPADTAQTSQSGAVLWDEYNALLLNGGLLHRGQWSQYISDGSTPASGGPWSALRVAVGDSEFAVGAGFIPAPGAVLNQLDDAANKTPVSLDPLALSVSAWHRLRVGADKGRARLAGTIATRNGPATAYWDFDPAAGESTLLGTSMRNFVAVCEASLYPTPSDCLQLEDGTQLVLSYSHLYRYDETAPISEALPGLPTATLGHPGGRCLREAGTGGVRFFTEFFGGVGAPLGGDRFAQFYNTLRTLVGGAATSGKGTVFHGDNCAELFGNRYYGWAQVNAFGDEDAQDAQQFLAFLQDGAWVADEFAPFPASTHHWQRLRALSTPTGRALVASGKEATGERAIWAVVDGQRLREATLPFRARRLTTVPMPDGTERLYAVGRFLEEVDGTDAASLAWSVIRLGDGDDLFVHVCAYWDAADEAFAIPRAAAVERGLDPAKLPQFLKWNADAAQPAGGTWSRAPGRDADELPVGVPYLALTDDATTIRYAPVPDASALPYDVFQWDHFCFTVYDDGGVDHEFWPPKPKCKNAGCVTIGPPGGVKYLIVSKEINGAPWEAMQVSDVSDVDVATGLRKLHARNAELPNLWLRIDSEAAIDDLSSYQTPCAWNQFQSLPQPARARIDVCVLVPDDAGTVQAPVIDRRDG